MSHDHKVIEIPRTFVTTFVVGVRDGEIVVFVDSSRIPLNVEQARSLAAALNDAALKLEIPT